MQIKNVVALSFGAILGYMPVVAVADFTVQSGQTVGSQTLNDGETGTVEAGGTISTSANGEMGILVSGDNATAINYGTITTSGLNANGIGSGLYETIINSGTITTSGFGANGIAAAGGYSIVTNSGSIITSGVAGSGISSGDDGYDTIINSGDITTSGNDGAGVYLRSDHNTLNNSGTISTSGDDAYGILVRFGGYNTINNSGVIDTSGTDAFAIYVFNSDYNTITNSGAIATSGDGGIGIYAMGDHNTVNNSGTINTSGNNDATAMYIAGDYSSISNDGAITTSGNSGYGILSYGYYNTVSNAGSINTRGASGFGMYVVSENNTVVNSGTINTSGGNATGIYVLNDSNAITNSGSVITSGVNSHGILALSDYNTINNNGSINVSGANAVGVLVDNNNTITNYGTIVSTQYQAMMLSGNNNTVNLMRGTVIQGGIALNTATNTFNYENGLNTAFTFGGNLPGSINSNGMPRAINGMLVATVDTTGFAMEDEVVTDITDCGHDGVGLRLDRVRSASGSGAWGNLCGNMRQQQDSGPAIKANHLLGGVAFGRDHALSSGRRFGWMAGASSSRVEVDDAAQEIDIKSVFGGIYGGRQLDSGTFIDMSLLVGMADHNSDRHVVNNLIEGGLETARADYDGYFVSPGIRIGTSTQWGDMRVQPSLDIRYAGMHLEGYREHGSAASVKADDRTLHTLSARAKLSFLSDLKLDDGRALSQESYIGIAGRSNLGNDDADIQLLGSDINFDYGGENSSLGLIAGFNATLNGKVGRVSAGFDGQVDQDGTVDLSAHVNVVMPF